MYETNGFLEKNRDLLHADLLQLLGSCDCALPQLFVASIGEGVQKLLSPTRRANSTESQKLSVATKFKVCLSHNPTNTWYFAGILHFMLCIIM